MNLKLMKVKQSIKEGLTKGLRITLTPIANLEKKLTDKQNKRIAEKCKEISDEELMKRFAEHIIKDLLAGRSGRYREYMVVHDSLERYSTYDDFSERIIYQLHNIDSSCKDKVLKQWKHNNKKARSSYALNDESEIQLIQYENKLNKLLKGELDKLRKYGIYAEYEDIRLAKEEDEVLNEWYIRWLNKIGYEKSLIVKIQE